MLTPEYMQKITEGAEELAGNLHKNIMDKIIIRMMARLSRGEDAFFTSTDKWQINVMQDAGILLSDIQKEISDITKKQENEIKEAMQDAGITALQYDDSIYKAAGLSPTPLLQSPTLLRLLERNYNATNAEWRNFTRTTATDTQRMFINAMDTAYNMVMSGAVSYDQAVTDAIKSVASQGMKVRYPTGYSMSIESATFMIVRTGIGQAAAEIAMKRMEEMDWDIILVSSHLGARVGDGGQNPGNHSWWQGKFYSRTGKDKRFPDFVSTTGYGTITGLSGIQCRHSFGAGDGENNPFEQYDSEDNRKEYEKQQRQRTLERRSRDTKRQVQNLQTAIDNCIEDTIKFNLQNILDKKSYLLKKQNAAYRQYCEANNLKTQQTRLQVAKWDREQALKAAGAARRYENAKGK